MTNPHSDGTVTADEHIGVDELADAQEDLIAPERQQTIRDHLAGCDRCRALDTELSQVGERLRESTAPTMPDAVFARLQQTLTAEQAHREQLVVPQAHRDQLVVSRVQHEQLPASQDTRAAAQRDLAPVIAAARPAGSSPVKPHLADHFNDTVGHRRGLRAKFAGGAVAAALLASTAGFGSYVLSASAGTDEPVSDRPLVVHPTDFTSTATRLADDGDRTSYRFTRAWRCVRHVTDGTIVDINPTILGGRSGYLALLKADGDHDRGRAVFVTGCDTGHPKAGPSVSVKLN